MENKLNIFSTLKNANYVICLYEWLQIKTDGWKRFEENIKVSYTADKMVKSLSISLMVP